MTKYAAIATLALTLLTAGGTGASARSHAGVWTTPRGTYYTSGSGSCGGDTCSSHGTITGPSGYSLNRQSTTTCAGGTCNSRGTITGPRGYSADRQTTTTCAGGTCNSASTITGPNGQTITGDSSYTH